MATTISTLSLKLSADSTSLEKTLDQSILKVQAFAHAVRSPLDGLATLASGLPGVGAALSGGLLGLSQIARETATEMKGIAREAGILGLSTEAFVGFQVAARGSSDSLATSLEHLSAKLGESSLGGKGNGDAFARFGLDGAALAEGGLESAVGVIADRFKELSNPTEKAAFAVSLFGKSGTDLIPFLEKGSVGLEMLKQKAIDTGVAFSALDVEKLAEAEQKLKEFDQKMAGLKRSATIGVAEASGSAMEQITEQFNILKDLGVLLGLTDGGSGGKKDTSQAEKDAQGRLDQKRLNDQGRSATEFFDKTYGGLQSKIASVFTSPEHMQLDKLREMGGTAEQIQKFKDAIDKLADENALKATEQAVAALDARLKESVGTWGMSANEIDIWKARLAGASDIQLDFARSMQDMLEQMNAMNDMWDKADAVLDGLATPLDRAQSKATELFQLFNSGLLNGNQLEQALGQAFGGVFGNQGPQFAGALEAGSAAALSAEHKSDARADDPQKQIVQQLIQANAINQRVLAILERGRIMPLFNVLDIPG